jgi:predicted RNA-binding protein associated with RNAse of E/G family
MIDLYRRRFIPNELIHLKDDEILIAEPNLIVTRWKTLHPRRDIARGISAFFLDQGFKVSKIYNKNDQVVYWYCDIIQAKKDAEKNTVIIEDLLIDVILYENGSIRIMDLDELADAQEQKLITTSETNYALRTVNSLLQLIYDGRFIRCRRLLIRRTALAIPVPS